MPIKIVTVSDTITVARSVTLVVHIDPDEMDGDEDSIKELAIETAENGPTEWDEEQVDAQPYEAEIEEGDGERLAELLTLDQSRLLDFEERAEMERLIALFNVSEKSLFAFREQFPFGSPPR